MNGKPSVAGSSFREAWKSKRVK